MQARTLTQVQKMYEYRQTLANETPGFGDSREPALRRIRSGEGPWETAAYLKPLSLNLDLLGLVSLASHDKVLSQLLGSIGLTLCVQFPTQWETSLFSVLELEPNSSSWSRS